MAFSKSEKNVDMWTERIKACDRVHTGMNSVIDRVPIVEKKKQLRRNYSLKNK